MGDAVFLAAPLYWQIYDNSTNKCMRVRLLSFSIYPLLLLFLLLAPFDWLAPTDTPVYSASVSERPLAAGTSRGQSRGTVFPARLGQRSSLATTPRLSIEPYVRPELATRIARLRPVILAAAARHNRPELSGMSNQQFAEVIALLLYNEHNGWLEDDVEPLRIFTPLYEHLQVRANESGIGSNFSVWPANLRPSVALEILRQQLPLPEAQQVITVPVKVYGSRIDPAHYSSYNDLLAAISAEIRQDDLAIEYLAANLERGLYRAALEGVPITWRTLAAWHNQGIMDPEQIRANGTARDYVRRASAYLLLAQRFIATEPRRNYEVRMQ